VTTRELKSFTSDILEFDNDLYSATRQKDARDIRTISQRDLDDCEVVVHLAALSNDLLGQSDRRLTVDVNFHATVRLAQLAKRAGVRRFVFASSCSVYGNSTQVCTEETAPHPLTAYARSKVAAERGLLSLADRRFQVVILRQATLYGPSPNMRLDLVVNRMVASANATGRVPVAGLGHAWRPLLDVRDAARVICIAASEGVGRRRSAVVNVGSATQNLRVIEIAKTVETALPGVRLDYSESDVSDERTYVVDCSRLHRLWPSAAPTRCLIGTIVELAAWAKSTGVSSCDIDGERFNRLRRIEQLLNDRRLTKDLQWAKDPAPLAPQGTRAPESHVPVAS